MDEKSTPTTTDCLSMEEYEALTTLEERIHWLTAYGHLVCKRILYDYLLNDHRMNAISFRSMIFTIDGTSVYTTKYWKDIKTLIGTYFYDRYIGFDIDSHEVISPKLVTDFTVDPCTYSIPLFLAIAEDLGLDDDDERIGFEFIKAGPSGNDIIFRVIADRDISYYNFSQVPTEVIEN